MAFNVYFDFKPTILAAADKPASTGLRQSVVSLNGSRFAAVQTFGTFFRVPISFYFATVERAGIVDQVEPVDFVHVAKSFVITDINGSVFDFLKRMKR